MSGDVGIELGDPGCLQCRGMREPWPLLPESMSKLAPVGATTSVGVVPVHADVVDVELLGSERGGSKCGDEEGSG